MGRFHVGMLYDQPVALDEAFERDPAEQKRQIKQNLMEAQARNPKKQTQIKSKQRSSGSPDWETGCTDMNSLHDAAGLQLHDDLQPDGRYSIIDGVASHRSHNEDQTVRNLFTSFLLKVSGLQSGLGLMQRV